MTPEQIRRLAEIVHRQHPAPSQMDSPVTYYTAQAVHAVAAGLAQLADDLEREAALDSATDHDHPDLATEAWLARRKGTS